jgi:hypothetical protein
MMNDKAARLIELLTHYCDSQTRAPAMAVALADESSEVFWPVFQTIWPISDATGRTALIGELLIEHFDDRELTGADAAFYDALPDEVEVWRGGNATDEGSGFAWTTERDVALSFARGHRHIKWPEPTVWRGLVQKRDILTVCATRDEAEVLVEFEDEQFRQTVTAHPVADELAGEE